MNRIWSIIRYEYWRHIRRRAFLVVALGIPLLIVGSFASIVVVVSRLGVEHRLGLVDPSGRFTAMNAAVPGARRTIPVVPFADELTAQAVFRSRAIDAYVVIPEDYLRTGKIRVVGRRSLSERAEVQIRGLLEQGILATAPENLRDRLQDPAHFIVRTLDGTRATDAEDISLLFMPYA
ncbi:MAG: hypothetical protein M3380_07485, partial [Chloroflexota bacterium]|nr:hypothetical protein [Chloroflexota bacterium]